MNGDRCIYISPGIASLLGFSVEYLYSVPGFWHYQLHEDDKESTQRCFNSALNQTSPLKIEHRVLRSDGEVVWLETTVWSVQNSKGQIVLCGYSFDISSLMEKLDFSSALNRSLGEGVCALDQNGNVTYLNSTGVWLLEWTHGELMGKHIHNVAPISEEVLNGQSVSSEPVTFQRKSGHTFPVLYSANAIRKAGGKIVGTVIVFRDITKIRETESKLTQTKEELECLIKERTNDIEDLKTERCLRELFVASLTHDLRNPIATAKMGISLLQHLSKSHENHDPMILQIERNLERADRMIQNLLDVQQIEARKTLPLQIEKFNVIEMSEELLSDLELIHGKRVNFSFNSDEIQVHWCRASIWRMLENLLNNAHKYGAREKVIHLHIQKDFETQKVTISVKNEGPPIQDTGSLFKPFFRSEHARKSKEKGWGIGLTVVQGIVESHHGAIHVESSLERGTIFTVALPAKEVKEKLALSKISMTATKNHLGIEDVEKIVSLINEPSDQKMFQQIQKKIIPFDKAHAEMPSLCGVKILVLDDDISNQKLFSMVLKSLGAEVETSSSVHEAIIFLRNYCPDLILSDISMPDEDGFSFLLKTRELFCEQKIKIPIVALTAYTEPDEINRILNAGFDAHLSKSTKRIQLARTIKNLVTSAQLS